MRGFSLIEVLIALSLLVILGGIGFSMSFDWVGAANRRAVRDRLVLLLEKARANSLTHIDQAAWGVCLDPSTPALVLMRGSLEYERGAIARSSSVTGLPTCTALLFFEPLSGRLPAAPSAPLHITEDNRTDTILLNHAGQIDF